MKGRDFWVTTYMKSFVLQFSDYQSMISNLMGRKRITMVFEGNNVKIHDTGTPPINNAVRVCTAVFYLSTRFIPAKVADLCSFALFEDFSL